RVRLDARELPRLEVPGVRVPDADRDARPDAGEHDQEHDDPQPPPPPEGGLAHDQLRPGRRRDDAAAPPPALPFDLQRTTPCLLLHEAGYQDRKFVKD